MRGKPKRADACARRLRAKITPPLLPSCRRHGRGPVPCGLRPRPCRPRLRSTPSMLGQVEHRVEQDAFDDRAQAARAGLALDRLLGDRDQRIVGEGQLDILQLEQLLILLDQRVLRLGQDLHQRRRHRDPRSVAITGRRPTNSGIRPNLSRSSGSLFSSSSPVRRSSGAATCAPKPIDLLLQAVADDLFEAREGAAADEQDVGRVDLQEFLLRMLAPALRRHARRWCLPSA